MNKLLFLNFVYNIIKSVFTLNGIDMKKSILEKAELYFNKVQNIAIIGFWELDLRTKESWWSKQVFKIFELEPDEKALPDYEYLKYIHPEDLEKIRILRANAIKNKTGYTAKLRLLFKDGSIKYVINSAEVETNEIGEAVKFFGIIQDITEQTIQHNLVNEQNMRLASINNYVAIGEMAGGVAHEINNPLAIIKGKLDVIESSIRNEIPSDHKIFEHLKSVDKAVQRVVVVVNSLKRISEYKIDSKLIELNLEEVIKDAIALCLEKITSRDVKFSMNLQGNIQVKGRRAELVQVVLTLLYNAYDVASELDEKWIKLDVTQDNSEGDIVISVTDSGLGIPKEIQKKIMNPFFTTKPIGKGLGLGLSVARKIIEEYNGALYIDASSIHTKFTVRLPNIKSNYLVPLTINEAIDSHLKWKQQLLHYLSHVDWSLKPEDVILDNKCALGKWIYNTSNPFYNNIKFQSLKEVHKLFHEQTSDIIRKIHAGHDMSGIILDPEGEYSLLSNQVVKFLKDLENDMIMKVV